MLRNSTPSWKRMTARLLRQSNRRTHRQRSSSIKWVSEWVSEWVSSSISNRGEYSLSISLAGGLYANCSCIVLYCMLICILQVSELKQLGNDLLSTKTEVSRNDDTLREYRQYRDFLFSLSPKVWYLVVLYGIVCDINFSSISISLFFAWTISSPSEKHTILFYALIP